MSTVRLFYSYSHADEIHRKELEKHLSILKNKGFIDDWHDRKINAGENWSDEIERKMDDADIILLLFSPDFIASVPCQKEVKKALQLNMQKGKIFIPVILRDCAWQDIDSIRNIMALPKDGKPIKTWADKDKAWKDVYEGIKKQVERIRNEIMPTLKNDFKNELLKNPVMNCTLDKLFVYPDILEKNKYQQKLENNEIDSEKLTNIASFAHKHTLIKGGEQSGKTSLCKMLYLHYANTGFYPILITGKEISGKAETKDIIKKPYNEQYDSTKEYLSLEQEKRILIVDDINERTANDDNYANFLQSVKDNFGYAIIFIDELYDLSSKSMQHNYFYTFNDYVIKSLGHKKRDELIKKCIANDKNTVFSLDDTEQVARLDRDTKHINTIIGSNIVPSYPVFIISVFNAVEKMMPNDLHKTSYGHCYHAMITTQLFRANISSDSMDEYFNFLVELSYFMFISRKKDISQDELNQFLKTHKENYIFDNKITTKLINANILTQKNGTYSFQYIYIYYYFAAQYISQHIGEENIKQEVDNLLSGIHKKDNSNIVVLITHHTKDDNILDNTSSIFNGQKEATLEKSEIKFIDNAIQKLRQPSIPPTSHRVERTRENILQRQDQYQPAIDDMEDKAEHVKDNLSIEIIKSAKNMEIIGQIMKNQYGTFKKDRLRKLFAEGQNAGLRLLKSFIETADKDMNDIENVFQLILLEIAKQKGEELSKEDAIDISKKYILNYSYSVIFGWIGKIVDSLGYDRLIEIADDVNSKTNTVASKLINFSIHAWHKKELDTTKLKQLDKEFNNKKNRTAKYILRHIVSRHLYMHNVKFYDKQIISDILKFPVQAQILLQSRIQKTPLR